MLDSDNHPLKSGLEKPKGQPLHPSGFQAVLWAVIGDHEYFSNVLKLHHWASRFPCWECGAQSFEGAAPGKYVKKARFPYLQSRRTSRQKIVMGDGLHILFTKRIYGQRIGSILRCIKGLER